MDKQSNPERAGVRIGIDLTLLGALLMVLPGWLGFSGMSGGYALATIGFLVFVTGLVTWWIYQSRARTLERILAGDGLLAHWTYEVTDVERQATEDYQDRKARNRKLFFLMAAMLLVAGVFFFVIPLMRGADLSMPVVIVYFAVIPVIGLVAFVAPRLQFRHALRTGGDAWVAREGVYVRGQLHTWKAPLSRRGRVRLTRADSRSVLEFDIGHLSRVGWFHYEKETVRVAAPSGQEARAEEIANLLGGSGAAD